jgi:arginine-tRNA-protein transferase
MISLITFQADPAPCPYLPQCDSSLYYQIVLQLTPEEYQQRLLEGWRRFGHALFQPQCPSCAACLSLRIIVDQFQPNRSQRRCWKANTAILTRRIDTAGPLDFAKLQLYRRYHTYQHHHKQWPNDGFIDPEQYAESFLRNPFTTEEWTYHLQGQLLGVGYVDRLPAGLSAIYFFYDPDHRARALGTFHILSLIEEARRQRLPHVYLGYYVASCGSLAYKARFRPCEVYYPQLGRWCLMTAGAGDS